MRRIQDIKDLEGKKVLVRVDYNVPLKDGKVTNDERIKASFDTVDYLVSKGASVFLLSHLGRPEGEKDEKYSLKLVANVLEGLNKNFVQFIPDCIGEKVKKAQNNALPGEVFLLENVRFYPEEEKNEKSFAESLTKGFDLFINDAFSASHRSHASIVGVTEILPSYAGFSLQDEVDNLSKLLEKPERPFVFISGGAKVSDKIEVLKNLSEKADVLLIGGGMANTFLCAQGNEVGCSLLERDFVKFAGNMVAEMEETGTLLLLPEDVITTKKIGENAKSERKPLEDIDRDDYIADIGPNTIELFKDVLKGARTVFWNGPLGVSEYKEFANGTLVIAEEIANCKKCFSVIGGGDTIAAVPENLREKFDFVSMAGGASMEFLEGKELPGIKALN